jgi:hypothetical protein
VYREKQEPLEPPNKEKQEPHKSESLFRVQVTHCSWKSDYSVPQNTPIEEGKAALKIPEGKYSGQYLCRSTFFGAINENIYQGSLPWKRCSKSPPGSPRRIHVTRFLGIFLTGYRLSFAKHQTHHAKIKLRRVPGWPFVKTADSIRGCRAGRNAEVHLDNDPDLDDGGRFIFLGDDKHQKVLPALYMRSFDLQTRLQGDCRGVYEGDTKFNNDLHFCLWDPDGSSENTDRKAVADRFLQLKLQKDRKQEYYGWERIFSLYCGELSIYISSAPIASYFRGRTCQGRVICSYRSRAVMARFWDQPAPYVILILRCRKEVEEDIRAASRELEESISEAKEQARNNPTAAKSEQAKVRFVPLGIVFADWNHLVFSNEESRYRRIGAHPLYATWVAESDLEAMTGLRKDKNGPPTTLNQIETANKILFPKQSDKKKTEKTKTLVTNRKVIVASYHPREKSQQTVMGGKSATEVRKYSWFNPLRNHSFYSGCEDIWLEESES